MQYIRLKNPVILIVFAILMLLSGTLLGACGKKAVDPYEGMVLVPDGAGGQMWVTALDGLEVSAFTEEDFIRDGQYIEYRGEGYTTLRGIDVSEHQKEIDWQAVREDGVEFAIIRAGYRGYGEGGLAEDIFFRQNIEGALKAGLKVGVYFFSQAIDTDEAREEAEFLLGLIGNYYIELPVFYDWETVSTVGETRTEGIDIEKITDNCLAFSEVVKNVGYEPGVYFYRSQGYHDYQLERLADLHFWSAAPGDYPDFYYAHSVWQYSYTGVVSGVEGSVDLNILFEKLPDTGTGNAK